MSKRTNVYLNKEADQQFSQIKEYLKESSAVHRQEKNNSATFVVLIDTFYKLFIASSDQNFYERLSQLEKNFSEGSGQSDAELKSLRRQLDKILYLGLTNFHAITKGDHFHVQDLESIHSKLDPEQHELMERINDVIKEDVARGQTKKHSH